MLRVGDERFLVPAADVLLYFPPSRDDGGSLLLQLPWPDLRGKPDPHRGYAAPVVQVTLRSNPRLNAGQHLLDAMRGIYDEDHVVRTIGNYDVYQWPLQPGHTAAIDPSTGLRWGSTSLFVSTRPEDHGFFMECSTFAGWLSVKFPRCRTSLAWIGGHTGQDPRLNPTGMVLTVDLPKALLNQATAATSRIVAFVASLRSG